MSFLAKVRKKAEVSTAAVSRYYEHMGITYLYPARGGASVAISPPKSDGTYWVILFKPNKIISAQVLHHLEEGMDARRMIVLLLRYAHEKGFLKKNMPSVTPKELATLLLKKQAMNLHTFQKLFPELKSAATEDAVEIDGMKILHTDSVRNRDEILDGIKTASSLVKEAGFSHLIYGEVFLIGSAMKKNIAADYNQLTDQVRLKVNKAKSQIIRDFIHELGHRQYCKFKVDQAANNEKFNEVVEGRVRLKSGDIVKSPDDGTEYKIITWSFDRGKITYKVSFGEGRRGTAGTFIENWERLVGDKPKQNIFDVSAYAKTKNTEFWAEVFAEAITKKTPELLKWVKQVTA